MRAGVHLAKRRPCGHSLEWPDCRTKAGGGGEGDEEESRKGVVDVIQSDQHDTATHVLSSSTSQVSCERERESG